VAVLLQVTVYVLKLKGAGCGSVVAGETKQRAYSGCTVEERIRP